MKKKLTSDEISYFCEQLSLVLNAGMSFADGFEILCEDMEDNRMMSLCIAMRDDMNEEKTLSQAMEDSKAFPEYAVKMVMIGEMTGRLEKVLQGLSEYYDARAEMARTVRSSVLHPLMLLVMMTAVIVVLITLVIPMFGNIFSQFDSSVGETVKSTISLAYGVGTAMLIVLLVVIAVSVIVAVLSKIPSTRQKLANFVSVFPMTKRMAKRFSLSKISDAISMMVASGIAPDEVLENAAKLIDDKKLSQKLLECRKRVLDGEYFADVISTAGIFPSMYARSLKIAYSSGSFEKAWKKLADQCGDAAMETATNLVAFIEPAIVIVLTTVIGAILLTVMIPLMNIMSVLG
ncbi:MAG: type II secretion system F family protein [Oscillospiraceae bacterium]|nr:type II secretion system F family protein [Oscillospiraceae bacterium]